MRAPTCTIRQHGVESDREPPKSFGALDGRYAKGEGKEMDWNIIEGKWKELKGRAREQWGKLTDDELEEIGGKKDRLVGKLQQKYGYASDEADRQANEWAKLQDEKSQDGPGKS
jgi:uncharacterized protein YjbJ (UPF0337 family)